MPAFRAFAIGLACAALTALAACAGKPEPLTSNANLAVTQSLPAPNATQRLGATAQSDYRIGPLDVLDVAVLQSPDLNRTVRVSESGQITIPLVGQVSAGGRSVGELQADIADRLRKNYLRDPQVTVFVKEYTSQKVTVEGAVNAPGVYPLSGRTTLLQTIAMAKGADRVANTKGVIVFRTVNTQRMAAVFDLNAIRAGRQEDPVLFSEDVVVVDTSGSKAAWRDFLGAIPALAIFRTF